MNHAQYRKLEGWIFVAGAALSLVLLAIIIVLSLIDRAIASIFFGCGVVFLGLIGFLILFTDWRGSKA